MQTLKFSVLFILIAFRVWSQCPTSYTIFTTQAQIDNFATNFPGCTNITLGLQINGSGITNLNGLTQLTAISDLWVRNASISNLNGLHNLTSLPSIRLENLPNLNTITHLSNITDLHTLQTITCNSLPNLIGLNPTITSMRRVNVKNCATLTSIAALSNLSTAQVDISPNFNFENLPQLTNLQGLNNLTSIPGELHLLNLPITNLNELSNLTSALHIIIAQCNLTNLSGLNSLTHLTFDGWNKGLTVSNMPNFNSFEPVNSNLVDCGGIRMFACPSLASPETWPNLMNLECVFSQDMPGLVDLGTYPNITHLDYLYTWQNHNNLQNVDGLSTVTGIDLIQFSATTPGAVNLSGLSNVTHCNRLVWTSRNEDNMDFLENIIPGQLTEGFQIAYSNNLQGNDCDIPSVCYRLLNPNGSSTIVENNSTGCNSVSELYNICLSPMPIDFNLFEILTFDKTNVLYWSTEQELNSEKQVIERSPDGNSWLSIGEVQSSNITSANEYEFVDTKPLSSAYYRIKNVDFDGKEQYSEIRYVRNTNLSEVNDLQILLLGDMLTVNLPTSFESNTINLQIIDMMGRNIINENLFCNNENVIDFQLNEFIANHGIYIARVTCDGRSHELKFVK